MLLQIRLLTVRLLANIQVAFDVHNPNTNTMILDGVSYNVYVNNILMTSGNIGTEAPEDVIRSQNGFPIIGNSTVTLKDTQAVPAEQYQCC